MPSTISPTIVGCRNRLIVKWLRVARTSRIVSCWKSASVPAIAGLKRDNRIKSLTAGAVASSTHSQRKAAAWEQQRRPRLRGRLLGPFRAVPAHFVLGHDDAKVEESVVRLRVVPEASPFRQNLVERDMRGPASARGRREIMKRDAVVLRCDR